MVGGTSSSPAQTDPDLLEFENGRLGFTGATMLVLLSGRDSLTLMSPPLVNRESAAIGEGIMSR